jgi:hypothetical protein
MIIQLFLNLCFLIYWKKSELTPSQNFLFLGEHYRTDLGLIFSPCLSTTVGEVTVKEEEGSLLPSLERLEASVEEDKTVGAECGDAPTEFSDSNKRNTSTCWR